MKRFKVLAIDGGGIRGVIPAVWLTHIASQISGRLVDKFDLIVGTSTGSILSAAVALGKNIEECSGLYDQFGPTIFPRRFLEKNGWRNFGSVLGPEYSDKPLESALQRFFSIGTKLVHCEKPTVIVSYDVFMRAMFLLKSYDDSTSDIPVWEACKASSSAPTYFPAHILKYQQISRPLIDGGVFANNPSILALSEAIRLQEKGSIREFQQDTRIVLISLGTGSLQRRISIQNALEWGALAWLKPILDVMSDGSSEHAHFCAHHILTDENYVRLQVDLEGVNDDMDDASAENINALRNVATGLFSSTDGEAKLERILRLLSD